jgi:hypothetical protein
MGDENHVDKDKALFTMLGPGLGMAAARKDERASVVAQLEEALEEFEAKAAAEANPVAESMMKQMAQGLREKLELYKGLRAPSGQRPDEDLEEYACRYKAEAKTMFMNTLEKKIIRLMLLAGTEGDNAKWTQNQIFYGLREAVPGVTPTLIEEAITDLMSGGYIRSQERPGKASLQYVLTEGGARCAREYEEEAMKGGGSLPESYDSAPSRDRDLAKMELRIEQGIDKSLTLVNQRIDTVQKHQGLLEARLAKVEHACANNIFGPPLDLSPLSPEKLIESLKDHMKSEYDVDLDAPDDKEEGDPIGDILKSWSDFETYVRKMFRALGVDEDGNGTPHSRRRADFLGLAIRLSSELYDAAIERLGPNRNESLDADFVLSRVANIHDLLIELKAPGAIERSGKSVRKVCMGIVKDEDEREKEEADRATKEAKNKETAEARRKKIADTIITVYRDGSVDQEWLEGPTFQAVYDLLKIESYKVSEDEVILALEALTREGRIERLQTDPRIDPRFVLIRPEDSDDREG